MLFTNVYKWGNQEKDKMWMPVRCQALQSAIQRLLRVFVFSASHQAQLSLCILPFLGREISVIPSD